jgi:hypothetical protein
LEPSPDLHSHQLLEIAREAVMRARDSAAKGNALTGDAILAIVMAAASTEAFINEFAEWAPWMHSFLGLEDTPAAISDCAAVLEDLEEARAPVAIKYLFASRVLSGKAFNRGSAPYQDFQLLIGLRNAIMHVKPAFGGDSHQGKRLVAVLSQRGFALASAGYVPSWFDQLMSPAVATWAHAAALDMVNAFLDLVPITPSDPLEHYRQTFRDHPRP